MKEIWHLKTNHFWMIWTIFFSKQNFHNQRPNRKKNERKEVLMISNWEIDFQNKFVKWDKKTTLMIVNRTSKYFQLKVNSWRRHNVKLNIEMVMCLTATRLIIQPIHCNNYIVWKKTMHRMYHKWERQQEIQ